MKTSLLLVLVTGMFLVLTAGSCLQGKHIVGSKNYISKEVKADHFNEIKLVGSANISYWQDTCSHVEIHGSDNIIPLIETYVAVSYTHLDVYKRQQFLLVLTDFLFLFTFATLLLLRFFLRTSRLVQCSQVDLTDHIDLRA